MKSTMRAATTMRLRNPRLGIFKQPPTRTIRFSSSTSLSSSSSSILSSSTQQQSSLLSRTNNHTSISSISKCDWTKIVPSFSTSIVVLQQQQRQKQQRLISSSSRCCVNSTASTITDGDGDGGSKVDSIVTSETILTATTTATLRELEELEQRATTFAEWNEVVQTYAKNGYLTEAEQILKTKVMKQPHKSSQLDSTTTTTTVDQQVPFVETLVCLLESHLSAQKNLHRQWQIRRQRREAGDGDGVPSSTSETTTRGGNEVMLLNGMMANIERADDVLRTLEGYYNDNDYMLSSSSHTQQRSSLSHDYYEDIIHSWHQIVLLFSTTPSPTTNIINNNNNNNNNNSPANTNWILPRGIPQRATRHLETMERNAQIQQRTGTGGGDAIRNRDAQQPPSVGTYNAILEMWGYSDEMHYSSMAESIFRRAFQPVSSSTMTTAPAGSVASKGSGRGMVGLVEPNANTFRIMMRAWCRVGAEDDTDAVDSKIKAKTKHRGTRKTGSAMFNATGHLMRMQELLEQDERKEFEPTLEDYLVLLEAWGRVHDKKHSARRALSVLLKMESLYINRLTDIRPNTDCYKHVLRILSQSNPHHTHNPSNNNNNNNSNNNDDNNHHHMGKEASHLLLAMEERALLPDSDCFSYAIRTWCNHATASSIMVTENDNDRDQSRQRMRQERVMEEAGRADDLLGRMEEMYHRSSVVLVKPRTEDYNNVIRAWSRCVLDGAVQMAEKRLIKMENVSCDDDDDDDGSSGGTKDILPTAESYISVIHAYANNPTVTHKVDKAKIVLERMSKQYENGNTACKPTVESFNALISVCGSDAFATITTTSTTNTTTDDDKTKALTCAVETLNQMHRHKDRACRPNSNTYSLLLSAFGKLLSFEDRDANHIWNQQRGHTRKNHLDKAIESTFAKCCAEGLVDDSVIRTLQQVAPYDLYRSIVLLKATSIASNRGDGEVEGGLILPHEWTRNTARRGGRQYNIPLTVDGTLWNSSTVVSELKMRRLRSQNNKKLLQGGRM